MSNYATKTDIKNISHVHTRSFALCVPDIVKNLNVKVLNIMSRTNEICKCKCRLDASVCNNKQRCNGDKCRCECKELIDKGVYDKDLFGILVTASVNVINHVILVNI